MVNLPVKLHPLEDGAIGRLTSPLVETQGILNGCCYAVPSHATRRLQYDLLNLLNKLCCLGSVKAPLPTLVQCHT